MNRKTQILMASCLLSGSVVLIGAMLYLVYVFPKTAHLWSREARQLSGTEMRVVDVSHMAQVFGIPILGLLILSIVAAVIWLVISIQANRKDSANQVPEDTARKLADPQH